MTSSQESSPPPAGPGHDSGLPLAGVESLGGAYHPHLIEVQDFGHYGLIVDLRTAAEYAADHVPGAVRQEPSEPLVAERESHYLRRPPDDSGSVLVYCRDGSTSGTFAQLLREDGREVDVIPGGWASYRRWVEGGLNLLPRLVAFRIVCSSLRSECSCVLEALRNAGEQVLDLGSLAGLGDGLLQQPDQPPQQLFESRLLAALRELRGDCVVYVDDLTGGLGELVLPAVLGRSLLAAPYVALDVPIKSRVARLRRDSVDVGSVLSSAAGLPSVPQPLRARLECLDAQGRTDEALACWLQELVDPVRAQSAERSAHRRAVPPLRLDAFDRPAIDGAVQNWLRTL